MSNDVINTDSRLIRYLFRLYVCAAGNLIPKATPTHLHILTVRDLGADML